MKKLIKLIALVLTFALVLGVTAMAETIGTNGATAFKATATPTFEITFKAYRGLSDAGEEISALTAGTTYLKVTATYTSPAVLVNGKIKIEILDASGKIVTAIMTNRTLTSVTTFGSSFNLKAGQSARAYVDDGRVGTATIGAAK